LAFRFVRPLRDLPPDKGVVLGLLSTKRAELESVEDLIARVHEASRYYPLERIALSTQCGFGTVWEGNPIAEAVQEAKLKRVAQVAREIWH
jgi:5-methyltetrahydropteroyltriglutamate--homocysteine methyltransferase